MPAHQTIYTGFEGVVKVYAPGSTGAFSLGALRGTSLPSGANQFGTLRPKEAPWFTLSSTRGVASGALSLWSSKYDTGNELDICRNDIVVFYPEGSTEWARLIVKSIATYEDFIELTLEGESSVLMGRPAVDADDIESYAEPDDGLIDTDALTVTFYDMTPGAIATWILNNSLAYFDSNGSYPAYWHGNRDIQTGTVGDWGATIGEFQIASDMSCEEALRDLADIAQGDGEIPTVWGIRHGAAREFVFKPQPSLHTMTWRRGLTNPTTLGTGAGTATNVLNFPSVHEGLFYNVVQIQAGGGIVAVVRDEASILANGGYCSRATISVPSIRSQTDAEAYAAAFLKRYATPQLTYEMIQAIVPSATTLPDPLAGYCLIRSNGDDDNDHVPIQSIVVRFDVQPLAEISVGWVDRGQGGSRAGGLFSNPSGRSFSPGTAWDKADQQRRQAQQQAGSARSGATQSVHMAEVTVVNGGGASYKVELLDAKTRAPRGVYEDGCLPSSGEAGDYEVGDEVVVVIPSVADKARGDKAFIVASTGGGGAGGMEAHSHLTAADGHLVFFTGAYS